MSIIYDYDYLDIAFLFKNHKLSVYPPSAIFDLM